MELRDFISNVAGQIREGKKVCPGNDTVGFPHIIVHFEVQMNERGNVCLCHETACATIKFEMSL